MKQTPLPEKYGEWQGIAQRLMRVRGKREAELKIALNKSFQPTNWFGKDAWCRGIIDLNIEANTRAVALDYKTGKRKPESTQLQLFAALLMHAKPYLESVRTGFIWLKDKKLDTEKFERDQLGIIWQEFVPRVQRMETAYQKDKWQAQPSGLCRNWCPCVECEFNGKYKGKS